MLTPHPDPTTAKTVLRQALGLSSKDRARLATRLIESLDGEKESGVDAAWDAEIKRRMEEVKSGKAKFVSWEKVRAELRRIVRKPR